jgi:hypothetical protein
MARVECHSVDPGIAVAVNWEFRGHDGKVKEGPRMTHHEPAQLCLAAKGAQQGPVAWRESETRQIFQLWPWQYKLKM